MEPFFVAVENLYTHEWELFKNYDSADRFVEEQKILWNMEESDFRYYGSTDKPLVVTEEQVKQWERDKFRDAFFPCLVCRDIAPYDFTSELIDVFSSDYSLLSEDYENVDINDWLYKIQVEEDHIRGLKSHHDLVSFFARHDKEIIEYLSSELFYDDPATPEKMTEEEMALSVVAEFACVVLPHIGDSFAEEIHEDVSKMTLPEMQSVEKYAVSPITKRCAHDISVAEETAQQRQTKKRAFKI